METTIATGYKYSGLGIELILKQVELYKVGQDWLPKIDVEKLAKKVLGLLPFKSFPFTGNEIAFIRTYLKMSKSQFGKELSVSHTAVAKWEMFGKKTTSMDVGTELFLRMLIAEKLSANLGKYKEIYLITKNRMPNMDESVLIIEDSE